MRHIPDPQNDAAHYEGGENLEIMLEAKNYNCFLRDLVRRFAVDTSSVLDFGAGIGTFSDSLGIPHSRVTCIETDTNAQAHLSSMGFKAYANLSEIADGSFDYIFTLNVLEHIEDDGTAVSELYRVLKPGGRLFVYVPAFEILYSAMDTKVGHYRRYRIRGMTQLLQSVGFHIDRIAYTDPLGFLATLAYKVLDKNSNGVLNKSTVRFYDRYLFPISRILSLPLSRIIGKNLIAVAERPRG